jgi:Skp family chaperone for outer membrane proteins
MIRWGLLLAGVIAMAGAAFVAGASVPVRAEKPPADVKADAGKPPVVVGQKTGYFNMAKVMREYKRAKTAAERLNLRRERMAANLIGLRAMYTELDKATRAQQDPQKKDEMTGEMIRLARQIEDLDRAANRILNDKASLIIAELYDEMYTVVTAVARENGLVAVLAYPDATTRDEMQNPHVKELKLKPPAAQPFFVDSSVEYSDEIVRRLNAKFDAENDE